MPNDAPAEPQRPNLLRRPAAVLFAALLQGRVVEAAGGRLFYGRAGDSYVIHPRGEDGSTGGPSSEIRCQATGIYKEQITSGAARWGLAGELIEDIEQLAEEMTEQDIKALYSEDELQTARSGDCLGPSL